MIILLNGQEHIFRITIRLYFATLNESKKVQPCPAMVELFQMPSNWRLSGGKKFGSTPYVVMMWWRICLKSCRYDCTKF